MTAGRNHILCSCDRMAVIHQATSGGCSHTSQVVALRQAGDRRLVERFAGGTRVGHLLDDPAEGIIAVGDPPADGPRRAGERDVRERRLICLVRVPVR